MTCSGNRRVRGDFLVGDVKGGLKPGADLFGARRIRRTTGIVMGIKQADQTTTGTEQGRDSLYVVITTLRLDRTEAVVLDHQIVVPTLARIGGGPGEQVLLLETGPTDPVPQLAG